MVNDERSAQVALIIHGRARDFVAQRLLPLELCFLTSCDVFMRCSRPHIDFDVLHCCATHLSLQTSVCLCILVAIHVCDAQVVVRSQVKHVLLGEWKIFFANLTEWLLQNLQIVHG